MEGFPPPPSPESDNGERGQLIAKFRRNRRYRARLRTEKRPIGAGPAPPCRSRLEPSPSHPRPLLLMLLLLFLLLFSAPSHAPPRRQRHLPLPILGTVPSPIPPRAVPPPDAAVPRPPPAASARPSVGHRGRLRRRRCGRNFLDLGRASGTCPCPSPVLR